MNERWDPAFRYFILTLVFILTVFILWTVRAALQPLLIAALTAYFLSPAIMFFNRRVGLSHRVSANLVFFLVLALLIALPFTILPGQLGALQGIYQDLNAALDRLQSVLNVQRTIGSLRVDLGALIPSLRANLGGVIVPKPEDALRLVEIASRNFLWTLVILVTTYYLMTDWERLRSWVINIAPPSEQPELESLYADIRRVWMGYLGGQIRLIVVLALLYAVAWILIGLPGALILGTLAGLLNLVPEIGPAAAAILAVLVAFLEGSTYLPLSNLWFALLTLGTYLLLNNVKTIWLQPRILGHSVRMHEGIVFVAIVVSIMLGGVLAVLVVVPLLATVSVVGRYVRRRLIGEPEPLQVVAVPLPEPPPPLPLEVNPAAPSGTPGKQPNS
jgi:predicted PurR-regulated permease PerM